MRLWFALALVTAFLPGVAMAQSAMIDGTPVKTQSSASVKPADFAALDEALLGKSRGDDPYFAGSIDELRIGCRALTPDEIKNLAHP